MFLSGLCVPLRLVCSPKVCVCSPTCSPQIYIIPSGLYVPFRPTCSPKAYILPYICIYIYVPLMYVCYAQACVLLSGLYVFLRPPYTPTQLKPPPTSTAQTLLHAHIAQVLGGHQTQKPDDMCEYHGVWEHVCK